MPIRAFEKLPEQEKEHIYRVCLGEFAEKGYAGASTNSIVKQLGIPKGSLFYWFGNKDELYLNLVTLTVNRFVEVFEETSKYWPREILARLRVMIESSLIFLERYPVHYRLFMSFMNREAGHLFDRFMKDHFPVGLSVWAGWFKDVETINFRSSSEEVQRLLMWVLAGIKLEIVSTAEAHGSPAAFRSSIMKRFDAVSGLLEQAVYRDPEHPGNPS